MIDAWRGLAALAVVIAHSTPLLIGGDAVCLFFVISGYCIAASTTASIEHQHGFSHFMWRRFRRIYPPYILSLGFFLLTRLIKQLMTGSGWISATWLDWLRNLTLTQWTAMALHPMTWEQNPSIWIIAHWSLNYEEQFYLVMGLSMFLCMAKPNRLRTIVLVLIVPSILWNLIVVHPSRGLFIEYWFLFGVGAMLYYRLCRDASRLRRALFDATMAICLGWCIYERWTFAHPEWSDRIVRSLLVGSAFALLLVATRPLDERFKHSRLGYLLMALGAITYSLYLVHQFNLVLAHSIAERIVPVAVLGAGIVRDSVLLAIKLTFHISVATVFWYFCERPFINKSGRQSPLAVRGGWKWPWTKNRPAAESAAAERP